MLGRTYLTRALIYRNEVHEEIKRRIKCGSDCSFVLSWYKMWSLAVREEYKLHALEREYPGKYFNFKRVT
jgi:hypothetical protein